MGFGDILLLLTVTSLAVILGVGSITLHRANTAAARAVAAAPGQTGGSWPNGIGGLAVIGVVGLFALRVFCDVGMSLAVNEALSMMVAGLLIAIGTIALMFGRVRAHASAAPIAGVVLAIGVCLAIVPYLAPKLCSAPLQAGRVAAQPSDGSKQVAAAFVAYHQGIEAVFDRLVGVNPSRPQKASERAIKLLGKEPSLVTAVGVFVTLGVFALITIMGFNRSTFARIWHGWPRFVLLALAGTGLAAPFIGVIMVNLVGSIHQGLTIEAWYAGLILGLTGTLWLIICPTELRTSSTDVGAN